MKVLTLVRAAWCAAAVLAVAAVAAGVVTVNAKRAQRPAPQFAWPEAPAHEVTARSSVTEVELARIGTTCVDGEVPRIAPPAPPAPPPPAADTEAWLRAHVAVAGAFVTRPAEGTVLEALVDGQERPLALGERVGAWRLHAVRASERDRPLVAEFRRVGGEERVALAAPRREVPALTGPALVLREFEGPFAEPSRDHVERQAWHDDGTATWYVPEEEVRWWRRWGEETVFRRLETAPTARGLKLLANPPHGPLDDARGFRGGDVIRDVDGVAVASVAELVAAVAEAASDGRIEFGVDRGAVSLVLRFVLLCRGRGRPSN